LNHRLAGRLLSGLRSPPRGGSGPDKSTPRRRVGFAFFDIPHLRELAIIGKGFLAHVPFASL
jgi:hypothetical protein